MDSDSIFFNAQTTLLDHPNKVALIVYTRKCNWHCFGCYNMKNLLKDEFVVPITVDALCRKISSPLVDLLIISGGEALLYGNELIDLMLYIKHKTDKPIRVDTNGSMPYYIRDAKECGAVDGFAMDIKFPFWNGKTDIMEKISGVSNIKTENLMESMAFVDGMKYSLFRTVAYPCLDEATLEDMKNYMKEHCQSPYYINPFYNI